MKASFKKFLVKVENWPRALQSKLFSGLRKSRVTAQAVATKDPVAVIKSRPATLEQRYQVLHDEELADEVFFRLKQNLYRALDESDRQPERRVVTQRAGDKRKSVFREAGKIAPGRPYFYLKPAGDTGLLFERSGVGWVICQAEKIVDRDLFLRQGEPLDQVSLYFAGDRVALPRVMSKRLGAELWPLAVYEQKLRQSLGLEGA